MSLEAKTLTDNYGAGSGEQIPRYGALKEACRKMFGQEPERFYRAPGRVELGGNHTDHQGGVSLSAAVR